MNIGRLIRTVSYLKPVQIWYQVKYRIFGFKRVDSLKVVPKYSEDFNISIPTLDEDEKYIERFKPEGLLQNRIHLLNDEATWKRGKWDYHDKTHLWNFNLHYFEYGIALVAMYKKTGKRTYFDKLIELYSDWQTSAKDVRNSDAWHPYTISLRLKNLLIIYGMLAGDVRTQWINLIKQDVFDQYRFLYKNQEKNLLGNHYFENLVTLYIVSLFFKEDEVRITINNALIREMQEQILPDGMHFERSFMYHNLILEDLLRIYMITDVLTKNAIADRVKRMSDCVQSFELEDRLPHFNDAASNVAKRTKQLVKTTEKIVGYRAINTNELRYAGYFKLEDKNFMVIFDVGEIAPKYISGHSHCDTLSFELFYKDQPILVNSGTYQYQTELRHYFRSTAANNTLKAAACEQSEIWGEHRTGKRARVESVKVHKNSISGIIVDYKGNELSRGITLKECIEFNDQGEKLFRSYWHIHPCNDVTIIDNRTVQIMTSNGDKLLLEAADNNFEDVSENCHYSEEIGKIESLVSFRSSSSKIRISIPE